MDKVPAWLEGVQVEFVCNNCPKRQVKNISEITLGPAETPADAEKLEIDNKDEMDLEPDDLEEPDQEH